MIHCKVGRSTSPKKVRKLDLRRFDNINIFTNFNVDNYIFDSFENSFERTVYKKLQNFVFTFCTFRQIIINLYFSLLYKNKYCINHNSNRYKSKLNVKTVFFRLQCSTCGLVRASKRLLTIHASITS